MSDAVVLSGGVARGAFDAGVLSVLLKRVINLDIKQIVSSSSGSLNAAYLASSIRNNALGDVGERLESLWINEATIRNAFDFNLRGLMNFMGLSDNDSLTNFLRKVIKPAKTANPKPINVSMIVTNLVGEVVGDDTTFEHVVRFNGSDFDSKESLEDVFAAVTASGAFPGVYMPVNLTISGAKTPCVDGGVCNNSPIKYAIEDKTVSRVFVVAPYPKNFRIAPTDMKGVKLFSQMADILINERLYRDLYEAYRVNDTLASLDNWRVAGMMTQIAYDAAIDAFGYVGKRKIDIVIIRPEIPLPGGAFDGLSNIDIRRQYVKAGQEAAKRALI